MPKQGKGISLDVFYTASASSLSRMTTEDHRIGDEASHPQTVQRGAPEWYGKRYRMVRMLAFLGTAILAKIVQNWASFCDILGNLWGFQAIFWESAGSHLCPPAGIRMPGPGFTSILATSLLPLKERKRYWH